MGVQPGDEGLGSVLEFEVVNPGDLEQAHDVGVDVLLHPGERGGDLCVGKVGRGVGRVWGRRAW